MDALTTAHSATDKALDAMEKYVRSIYLRSVREIYKSWQKFFEKERKRIDKLQEDYEKAKKSGDKALTKKTGIALVREKKKETVQNKRFQDAVKQTAENLLHVNEKAVAYLNGRLPETYVTNFNAVGELCENAVTGYSYHIVDENTVRELAMSDTSLLPYKEIDPVKDIVWNVRQMKSEVLQGILQGEDMQTIAKRLSNVIGMNENSAVRNARTMVTAAENKGRQDGFYQAEEDGIILEKYWLCVHGERTREAHAAAGNDYSKSKSIPQSQPFIVGGEKLMFPGDNSMGASGWNLYNCRCSVAAVVKGFKKAQVQKAMEQAELTATEKVRSAETRQQLESELSKITGAKIDLTGTDIDLMRENMVQLVSLGEEYGFRFSEIVSTGARKYLGEVTRKGRYGDIVTMQYPKTFYKSKSSLLSELRNNSERGEMPIIPGRKISIYTTTHEFAHTLSEELVSRLYDRDVDFWDEIEDVYARYRKSGETVLGKYATSNQNEFMAEAFAYAKLGNRPNEYSDEVLSIIDKYFKRKKK